MRKHQLYKLAGRNL